MKRWWKRAYKPHSLQGAIHLVLVNTISVSLLGCALRMTRQPGKGCASFSLLCLLLSGHFARGEEKYFTFRKLEKFLYLACGPHTDIQT